MRRMTPRLATAALAATLALAATPAPRAEAAAVQSYSYWTSGSVADQAGNSPITFNSNDYPGTLTTPGSFSLGQFSTNISLPSTATLTYDHTPFAVDLSIANLGVPPYYGPGNAAAYIYRIAGELNGSFVGGTSSMMATITSITGQPGFGADPNTAPPFPIADLKVLAPQGIAASQGWGPVSTPLTAYVASAGLPLPSPAPEPTSIAAFAAALAGWGLRRRLRARAA